MDASGGLGEVHPDGGDQLPVCAQAASVQTLGSGIDQGDGNLAKGL